jgi:hypothetical protein
MKTLEVDDNGERIESISFRALNPVTNKFEKYTGNNDYWLCFFVFFPFSSFNRIELQKFNSNKWKRLATTKFSSIETDIVWRIWNRCVITPKIANLMGLFGSDNCPHCGARNPNCEHLVVCPTADCLWEFIWELLRKMEIVSPRKEKLFGYDGEPLLNTLVFLAVVVVYRRIRFYVNSANTVYDLVKSYKNLLYVKIYMNYLVYKTTDKLDLFTQFWGDGTGIFVINSGEIDIFL